ncbi:DUF4826 family protein [Rheinheimera sp.]|uniref:DUF4826 family protein n=1 Tax=Rheinheimera sp. TaxID=1869214 RepID=UPI0027BAEACB|nr:DUF4826 family protein [Rheinheimera sp.]
MTSNNQQLPEELTEAQASEWVRTQFQKANLHLAEKGVLMDNVAVQESRYLPPYVAVWKINALDRKSYWVISGDLPTDYIEIGGAANAREALRAFSFRWQMKAQQLMDAGVNEQTAADYIKLLISRAHSLYDLFESEKLWANT